jgi:hypothetical protein
MMGYFVADYNGTPTLIKDGQPIFYGLMWGSAPSPNEYLLKECASRYAEAGIHYFTFDMGTSGSPPDWCGPNEKSDNHYDFSTLQKRFQQVLEADPQAHFHLRIHLEMPEWWQNLYPLECELLSDGNRMCQSFASTLWREQAKDFLKSLVQHLKDSGLSERVAAYQAGTGSTGEWVKGPGAMGLTCGDYSEPMLQHFQSWLRTTYQNDESSLKKNWGNANVTFNTARVPAASEQFNAKLYTFRDPQTEKAVIDYYRCLAELSADLCIDFCSTIKEATGGQALAGAFYGYLMELAWNAGFFGEGVDSYYSTYQRSGHLGLSKVLSSPQVDFLVSPYSYGFRGIGGDGPAMPPSESLRIHRKLYIFEDDSRTHLTLHDHPNYGKASNLEDSLAVLKRNFCYVVTHGQGMWWLAGGSPKTPHIELSQEAGFRQLIQQFQEIGSFALNLDRTPSAEIAVLLDSNSFFYESLKNSLDLPLIFQQKLWGLAHLGTSYDVYLLQDFLDGKLKPYKLYIFLNAFQLDDTRRDALVKQIRQQGRVALWLYAPGYLNQTGSTEYMTELTGIQFESGNHPWGPLIDITNQQHPITQDLPQDLSWGTNNLLSPIFHVADESTTTLGNVVYAQGRCLPGFVVKQFPEWTSIYSAAPNLPAPVLRGIARFSGVHLYSISGDVLYATPQLLAVHSATGGHRRFQLPGKVDIICELFNKTTIVRDSDNFQMNLPAPSTMLFYTGKLELLGQLPGFPG